MIPKVASIRLLTWILDLELVLGLWIGTWTWGWNFSSCSINMRNMAISVMGCDPKKSIKDSFYWNIPNLVLDFPSLEPLHSYPQLFTKLNNFIANVNVTWSEVKKINQTCLICQQTIPGSWLSTNKALISKTL